MLKWPACKSGIANWAPPASVVDPESSQRAKDPMIKRVARRGKERKNVTACLQIRCGLRFFSIVYWLMPRIVVTENCIASVSRDHESLASEFKSITSSPAVKGKNQR